jgi:hypothetical protein
MRVGRCKVDPVIVVNLIRRCAWCGRLWTGEGWEHSTERVEPDHETSTICPHCVDMLVAHGQTAG